MSVYRSYFQKNTTLIEGNATNNSQNPVGEISYGTPQGRVSRIIFKPDFSSLLSKIASDSIQSNKIVSHKLVLKNTISTREDLLGGTSYSETIQRASSFTLDLFTLTEDWDEGSGYSFIYDNAEVLNFGVLTGASNWYQRKTGINWTLDGAYLTGTTGNSTIIGSQSFQKGNESISIDITNYINGVLYSGVTTYGLGLKFSDQIELIKTTLRQAVAFHLKKTNTVFEPYIETTINDVITDDRKFFFLDKVNELYLYSGAGDVTVNSVTITDQNDNVISYISGSSITRVRKGVYKITYFVDSDIYPDEVIFHDIWNIYQEGKIKNKDVVQDFFLINQDRNFSFELANNVNPDNFYFTYFGIKSEELIKAGDIRKVSILVKQLYDTQDDVYPFDIKYRVYIKQNANTQMDIIPFTPADRTSNSYEFMLDTSWLIPQDYFLELKFTNNSSVVVKSPMKFTIINDDIFAS